MIAPSVARLLGPRRPSAVPRLVAAIVISPVDAVLWAGSLAHVFVKIGKPVRPLPALANRNSAAGVALVRLGVPASHITPIQYALPNLVLRRVGHTMCRILLRRRLPPEATARASHPFLDVREPKRLHRPAIATDNDRPPLVLVEAAFAHVGQPAPPRAGLNL